ncbi:MAG: hypothetical protein D6765_11715 [Bacteroidetes bacterium]|nr:MAG: hypothetical protein D6765_11715 [Bacteroidota bacterium]
MKPLFPIVLLLLLVGCRPKPSLVLEDPAPSEPTSAPSPCRLIRNPFAVEWMNRAIDRHNPYEIVGFKKGKEWVYLLQSEPYRFWYDCHGHLICSEPGDPHDPCDLSHLESKARRKIIWQGEGLWD